MRRDHANELGIESIADLANHARDLSLGYVEIDEKRADPPFAHEAWAARCRLPSEVDALSSSRDEWGHCL